LQTENYAEDTIQVLQDFPLVAVSYLISPAYIHSLKQNLLYATE